MPYSEVQICNLALNEIGEVPITSLDDATKPARTCKLLYALSRDKLLSLYKWNFAMARATLAQIATAPAFEYSYQYQLPSDCMRAFEVYGSSAKWLVEGDKLLTNDTSVSLLYIKRATDPTVFTAQFVNCLSLELAAALAMPIANDKGLKTELMNRLKASLLDAFALNAVERHPDVYDVQPDTSWQDAIEGA